MAKETMLTYLDRQVTKHLGDYEVAIDWDTRNHAIELIVRLFAENTTNVRIDDKEGVTSEEEIIEFEDALLFYDARKTIFDADDYLATIPFEGKKGIKQSVLDAVIAYLPEILVAGQDDLFDFLASEADDATFELVFSANRLAELQAAIQTDADVFLPYPSY